MPETGCLGGVPSSIVEGYFISAGLQVLAHWFSGAAPREGLDCGPDVLADTSIADRQPRLGLIAAVHESLIGTFETITDCPLYGRFREQTGKHLLVRSLTGFDPTRTSLHVRCCSAIRLLADVAGVSLFQRAGSKGDPLAHRSGAGVKGRPLSLAPIHRPAFAATIGQCQPCGPRATAVGKIGRQFVITTKGATIASLLDCKLSLRLRADRPDGRGTFVPAGQTGGTYCCFVSLPAGP